MFSSKTTIEKLTTEVLINITSFLNVASILQLSLTSKAFSHLIKDELVFRQLVERDFHVTEKQPDQTWVDLYKQKRSNSLEEQVTQQENSEEEETINLVAEEDTKDSILSQESFTEQVITQEEETTQVEETMQVEETTQEEDTTQEEVVKQEEEITQEEPTASNGIPEQQETTYIEDNSECPHLNQVSDSVNEIKRIIYKSGNQSLCDLCLSQTASYLNMSDNCHYEACRQCLESNLVDDEHFPIQFELSTGDMYCFKCNPGHPRKLIDSEKVESIVEYIKAPASSDDLDKRRKAEHQLYVQELRREDMSLKHYLVEKQWGRTWMLFRTREGSPLPGKITNSKLARSNGTLDPNIRLPMDKFRPSPETHGDIVSERLWSYLVKAYGVQGRAYSEDDIIAPEYARLRVYVDDFKKSINLYP